MSDSLQPHGIVHGILPAIILEWVAVPFSRGLPNPGIEPRSPAWKVDSLPAELPVKPETYGFLQILYPGVGRVRTERTHLPP